MQFSINPALWQQGPVFAVPHEITDRYIRRCSGQAVKCLLLLLRDPAGCNDANALAERLNYPLSEISDALIQLADLGILLCDGTATAVPQTVEKPRPAAMFSPPVPTQAPTPTSPPEGKAASPVPAARPHFPREESVSIVEEDTTLRGLLGELQSMMGKLFTSVDLDSLVALYSFYALTPHYIITLVNYCVSIKRVSMGYAEKVAVSWIADGIDDEGVDRHVDLLLKRRGNEGRIRTAFGINDRNLTSREREYIATWFDSYHFDLPLVEHAYEITVERTGKLAFGYLNKILASWHENGIRTLEEARHEAKSGSPQAAAKSSKESGLDRKILEKFMKD